MSNLKRDGMRMPTVGSNDQLARTTVTGQNVFDKLVPAKLPGQRPPTESPMAKNLAQNQAMFRAKQLGAPLKKASAKPFYGRTGALYKPEFGPVVSQVPPPQPVKGSPKVPFPNQTEQAMFSPKQANSIHMNNIPGLSPVARGFLKRASELGMSEVQIKSAVEKLAASEGFKEDFEPLEKQAKGPFGFAKDIIGGLWSKGGKTLGNVSNWFNTGAKAAPFGPALPRSMAGATTRAGRQAARDAAGWNPFYNARAAQNLSRGGQQINSNRFRGFWNSDLMHGVGGAFRGGLYGEGVDAIEDFTGIDSGVDWSTVGMVGGGLGGFGRAGRRLRKAFPNSRLVAGVDNTFHHLDKGTKFLPTNLKNKRQALGYGLGAAAFGLPTLKNYAVSKGEQAGVDAFRSQADAMAQSLGFNDAVSAAASPIGRAFLGYNQGGISGGLSGLMSGFSESPSVQNGQTVLANGMSSDDVWSSLRQLMTMMREQGVPQNQQSSVLSALATNMLTAPSELQRQTQ